MKKVFLTLVSFVLGTMFSIAQEFNCSVTVNSDKVSGSNKDLYKGFCYYENVRFD